MKLPTLDRVVRIWFVTFLVCVILWMASLIAFAQTTEDFKELHIPAKQTIEIKDGVLRMPHFLFVSVDYGFNITTPLQLIGKLPPIIHQKSIQSATGVLIVDGQDGLVKSISFDVRETDPNETRMFIQTSGYPVNYYLVTGLTEGEWIHVELNDVPYYTAGIVIYGPVCITNITIDP